MTWKKYEDMAESGPSGLFKVGVLAILFLFGFGIVMGVLGYGCSFASDAAQTVKKEIAPSALLKKYEWFKNASAQLDKKRADIAIYEAKIRGMEGKAKDRWAQDRLFQWETEAIGVKGSYNSLAAEYNAQMAKINWRFTNVGGLPAGASEPLPREFKPYEVE